MVDITDTNEMSREIQTVTEKRFDLLMSAPITMSSLRSHLGFLSDTDFANSLLAGDVHIPWDVDNVTATILDKIIWLFSLLREGHCEIDLTANHFSISGGDSRKELHLQFRVSTPGITNQ